MSVLKILLCTSITLILASLVASQLLPRTHMPPDSSQAIWQIEDDGSLSFFHGILKTRFSLTTEPFPRKILKDISLGIEFALAQGAALEISNKDLYHGHFLFLQDLNRAERTIEKVDALLFHSQEIVFYTEEMFRKRNVLVDSDGARILPCSVHYLEPGSNPYIRAVCNANFPKKYSMIGGSSGFYFVDATEIPSRYLAKYQSNLISIFDKNIIVGQPLFK